MTLKQIENSEKTGKIDKGIIAEICSKPASVIYKGETKKQILHNTKNNPLKMYFIVDVEVKRIEGKIVAYVIKKLYDKGEVS